MAKKEKVDLQALEREAEQRTENDILALLEDSRAEELKSYLARGRKLAAMSVDELRVAYVAAFRQWSAAEGSPDVAGPLEDAGAEFGLRGLDPPLDLVAPEFEVIKQAISSRFEIMSEDEKADMGAEVLRDVGLAKRKRQ